MPTARSFLSAALAFGAVVHAVVAAELPAPVGDAATRPAEKVVAVRTTADVLAAIAAGATRVTSADFVVVKGQSVDLAGRAAEQLAGGALLSLQGKAGVANGTVKSMPNSSALATFRGGGVADFTIDNVTLAPGSGGFLENVGSATVVDCTATTFNRYWYYGKAGSAGAIRGCRVVGGSWAETLCRVEHARLTISNSTFDQVSKNPNLNRKTAALRGDAPPYADGSPGMVAVDSTFVGNVTPGPLPDDDGGQMIGIDRFASAASPDVRAAFPANASPAVAKALVAAQLAQTNAMRAAGRTREQIVAANALLLPQRPAIDVARTLAARDAALNYRSKALFTNCTIRGDFRQIARSDTRLVNCTIDAGGPDAVAVHGQATYPSPLDRRLSDAEVVRAGSLSLENCTIVGKLNTAGLNVTITSAAATSQPTAAKSAKSALTLDLLKAGAACDARNHNQNAVFPGSVGVYCDSQQPMGHDEAWFRGYLRSVPPQPVYQLDAEYDWADPTSVAKANAYVPWAARIVREEWPGALVTWYATCSFGPWPWINNDAKQVAMVRGINDALAPSFAALDAITVEGYLQYGNEPPATAAAQLDGDAKHTRGQINEGRRIANGKPVLIQFMPRADGTLTGENVSPARAQQGIRIARELGACATIWDDASPANPFGVAMLKLAAGN